MTDPLDIASSKVAGWLYISYKGSNETESTILRLESNGQLLNHWPSGGQTGRLSTYESNVVVCLYDRLLIREYSPEGELVCDVRLSPAAQLKRPLHAIKVTGMHFVVSFGEGKDTLHRVCVVDLEGNISATHFDNSKSLKEMKVPICLAEDSERYIIVAYKDDNRLFLLSPILEYKRTLLNDELGKKNYPVRLCFDESNGKLFVAVSRWSSSKNTLDDHRILIFTVK